MKRALPWVPVAAAYAGLALAVSLWAPEWVTAGAAVVIIFLVLVYAAVAAAAFGAWRALGLALVPALFVLNFTLFMDSAAYDCYESACSAYQRILGPALAVTAGSCLLVILLALHRNVRRRSLSRGRRAPLRFER